MFKNLQKVVLSVGLSTALLTTNAYASPTSDALILAVTDVAVDVGLVGAALAVSYGVLFGIRMIFRASQSR